MKMVAAEARRNLRPWRSAASPRPRNGADEGAKAALRTSFALIAPRSDPEPATTAKHVPSAKFGVECGRTPMAKDPKTKKRWNWRRWSAGGGLAAIAGATLLLLAHHHHNRAELAAEGLDLTDTAPSCGVDETCDVAQSGVTAFGPPPTLNKEHPMGHRGTTLPGRAASGGSGPVVVASAGPATTVVSGASSGAGEIAGGVPEPDTWVLMFLGVAAVGGSLRTRTSAQGRPAMALAKPRRRR